MEAQLPTSLPIATSSMTLTHGSLLLSLDDHQLYELLLLMRARDISRLIATSAHFSRAITPLLGSVMRVRNQVCAFCQRPVFPP